MIADVAFVQQTWLIRAPETNPAVSRILTSAVWQTRVLSISRKVEHRFRRLALSRTHDVLSFIASNEASHASLKPDHSIGVELPSSMV